MTTLNTNISKTVTSNPKFKKKVNRSKNRKSNG